MALKIRLRRMGRKDAPTYRVVVAESSMPRDGRFVESLGHYNPRTEPITLVIDRERAQQWLAKGAVPTDTARSLLKKAGVYDPAAAAGAGLVASAVGVVTGAAGSAVGAVASVAGSAVDAVTGAAGSAVDVVAGAAGSVAGAIRGAVDAVRERVAGQDEDGEQA